MDTLIRLEAEELDNSLVDFIKSTFKGKKIAVHIYADEEIDETEYLLSDPIHKQKLLETIEEVNQKRELNVYTISELKAMLLNEVKA
jgi:PHD/YefM family antitoxin component YafN of YafNO toxin-antitoxin module